MNTLNRRKFLNQTAAVIGAAATLPARKVLAANDKVVIGCMGLGGRGTAVLQKFASRADVEIAYLCDPNPGREKGAQSVVQQAQPGAKPQWVTDFRRILEDKRVDAVLNATPDHWHALGTILACQAGKDVYVEKPVSHDLWEGRKMIEAARKYGRVVQVGTQTRSAPYTREAASYIRSGKLGKVHLVRVYNMMKHSAMKGGSEVLPAGFDPELWSGPAAKTTSYLGHNWLNFFEYSCGPIPGDAIHQLDLARLLMGDPGHPKAISHTGGIFSLKDGRDTPDTQLATFEFPDYTLTLEGALWTPYITKTPMEMRDKDQIPNWPFNSTRVEIYGDEGFMFYGRHGDGWQVFDSNAKLSHSSFGRQADKEHIENFIQCIRDRKHPAADVEQGHLSTSLCHLANASFRAGNQKLIFDPATETITNLPEANQYLKRASYRAPWVVPETV